MLTALSSLKFHKDCHQLKTFKCTDCNKQFVLASKLKQHRRKHVSQNSYHCFFGGCDKKYKYPQDLQQHTDTHQNIKFECDFCMKKFGGK